MGMGYSNDPRGNRLPNVPMRNVNTSSPKFNEYLFSSSENVLPSSNRGDENTSIDTIKTSWENLVFVKDSGKGKGRKIFGKIYPQKAARPYYIIEIHNKKYYVPLTSNKEREDSEGFYKIEGLGGASVMFAMPFSEEDIQKEHPYKNQNLKSEEAKNHWVNQDDYKKLDEFNRRYESLKSKITEKLEYLINNPLEWIKLKNRLDDSESKKIEKKYEEEIKENKEIITKYKKDNEEKTKQLERNDEAITKLKNDYGKQLKEKEELLKRKDEIISKLRNEKEVLKEKHTKELEKKDQEISKFEEAKEKAEHSAHSLGGQITAYFQKNKKQEKTIEELSEKLAKLVNENEKTIKELGATIANLEKEINEKDGIIKKQEETIEEQIAIISKQESEINEKKDTIEEKEKTIKELSEKLAKLVNENEKTIKELGATIANLEKEINEKDGIIKKQEETIEELKAIISKQEKTIEDQSNKINEKDGIIKKQEETIEELKAIISKQEKTIEDQSNKINEKDGIIKNQKKTNEELSNEINQKQGTNSSKQGGNSESARTSEPSLPVRSDSDSIKCLPNISEWGFRNKLSKCYESSKNGIKRATKKSIKYFKRFDCCRKNQRI